MPAFAIDTDTVSTIIRDVVRQVLAAHDQSTIAVREKSVGEPVTLVDQEIERALTTRLGSLDSSIRLVGEEATGDTADSLTDLINGRVWLIDPLDGTGNYAAGSNDFGTMVALLENGETVMSWIYQPITDVMYCAQHGEGATRNGGPIQPRQLRSNPTDLSTLSRLRGVVLTRFLPSDVRASVEKSYANFHTVGPGTKSAAIEYPLLATGELDFALFWRTLPWDHAPGALLVAETGGRVSRIDGSPYRPGLEGQGLLVCSDRNLWPIVASALFNTGKDDE